MTDQTRQRLRELIALLSKHPQGLTTTEIAKYLGVTRQTALADINRLTNDNYPIYQEGNKYYLDTTYKQSIHLSLPQTWIMYLLLRKLVRANLQRDNLVRSLLYEVAQLLEDEVAEQLLFRSEINSKEEKTIGQHLQDLVLCWRKKCLARVTYQKPNAIQGTHLTIAPWWFEPAPWTDGFYCICGLVINEELRPTTLKLDRIRDVSMLPDRFEPLNHSELLRHIENSWGIWMGHPVQVKLKFANHQYQRLRETRWHKNETVTMQSDGSIIWEALVNEPQEMLPWIRGWGADVEVLEPIELREQIISEAEATLRLYGHKETKRRFF